MSKSPLLDLEVLQDKASQILSEVRISLEVQCNQALRVDEELARDVKLELDRTSQTLIARRLFEETGIVSVGEEGFEEMPEELGLFWLIDPIDGSFNIWRGIKIAATSVALIQDGVPVVGVIQDLFSEDQISAALGAGVIVNDIKQTSLKTMNCGTESGRRDLLLTGITPDLTLDSAQLSDFIVNCSARFKKVRMLGSACISLLWFGQGRCDAVIFHGIHFWDIVAGIVIGGEMDCVPTWVCIDKKRAIGNFECVR